MHIRYLKTICGPNDNWRAGHVREVSDREGQSLIGAQAAMEVSEFAEVCPAWAGDHDRDRILREAKRVEDHNRDTAVDKAATKQIARAKANAEFDEKRKLKAAMKAAK